MFLAVIRCRAIAAPLNQAYTAEEFEFYLSDSESKLLITPKEGLQPAQSATSKLKLPQVTATLSDGTSSISIGNSVSTDSNSKSIKELVNDPSNVALFLHTSGTTSRPKDRQGEATVRQGRAHPSPIQLRQSSEVVYTASRGGDLSLFLSQTGFLSLSLSLSKLGIGILLFCFDSREVVLIQRGVFFFQKKKKLHAKQRRFGGCNGSSNRFVMEP